MEQSDPTTQPTLASPPTEELYGVEVVTDHGDTIAEHRALTGSVGLVERPWACLVELTGADRVRFANGLVTNDVARLEAGASRYTFLTTAKGRILADAVMMARPESLLLEVVADRADEVVAHLSKYLIADRVEISRPDAVAASVLGPKAGDALPVLPDPWRQLVLDPASLGLALEEGLLVERRPIWGVDAVTVWAPREHASAVVGWLADRVDLAGGRRIGLRALEVARVEAGVPRLGADFGLDTLPQETGLTEAAVSFDKGCYLGQEVVARIHYRGGVKRWLRGVRPAGEIAPGAELLVDGRPVGRATSIVDSPSLGRIGLGVLHERAEPGATAETEGGVVAVVVELPFTPVVGG